MNERSHPNVDLHIEHLVLHGFPAGDRHAIERELARLLAEQGWATETRTVEVARVDGGAFSVAPGARPEAVGAQIAQAVYGAVQGGGER